MVPDTTRICRGAWDILGAYNTCRGAWVILGAYIHVGEHEFLFRCDTLCVHPPGRCYMLYDFHVSLAPSHTCKVTPFFHHSLRGRTEARGGMFSPFVKS